MESSIRKVAVHSRKPNLVLPKTVYVIGAGGVTSYLLSPLLKTLNGFKIPPEVVIYDKDTLEKRNLDRQFFRTDQIGQSKAEALAAVYQEDYPRGIKTVVEFFHAGTQVEEKAVFFGCVDNHPARNAILGLCDENQGKSIFAANEYTDSQAMYYEPVYRGSRKDPRVRYPEILTDTDGDPMRPQGCTGEAVKAAPQLAIANFTAASHALQLFWFHFMVSPTLGKETVSHWPVEHSNNFNQQKTKMIKDYEQS